MPSAKDHGAPRKMDAGVVDVMRSRQERNNLSELGVNWIGKGHLNASESDLMYKYHVAHLSGVYGGRSKVNNDTPRSVSTPPPWANLDPRILSPIPDKKKREARWDDTFFRGNCLQNRGPSAERSSVSAGRASTARRRPASAGVRSGHERGVLGRSDTTVRYRSRPSSARVRGREANDVEDVGGSIRQDEATILSAGVASNQCRPKDSSGYQGGDNNCPQGNVVARGSLDISGSDRPYSLEEKDILCGRYKLDSKQKSLFRDFVAMLVDFDPCIAVCIIDDAFREAQIANGLQDFTGCGAE